MWNLSDYYYVNFNGENLYDYKLTVQEGQIVECFRQELIDICNRLDIPRPRSFDGSPYMGRLLDNHDFYIKFREDIGYFALIGNDRGKFSMYDGFPTKDKENAKFILLKDGFSHGGQIQEAKLRDNLEIEWSRKYNIKYDSRKFWFEYTIKMLKSVFGYFPEDIITNYTKHLNQWLDHEYWVFDKDKMLFEEKS